MGVVKSTLFCCCILLLNHVLLGKLHLLQSGWRRNSSLCKIPPDGFCEISIYLFTYVKTLKTPNTRLCVFNNLTTFKEWTVQSCTSCTGKWETAWMHRNEAILTFCKKQNKIFIRAAANEHVLTNKDSVRSNCKDAQYGFVKQKEWTSFFLTFLAVMKVF